MLTQYTRHARRCRRRAWIMGSAAAIAVGTPRLSRAQAGAQERGRDSTPRTAPQSASGSLYGLPIRRRPATPQPVEHAGDMRRYDGSFATSPTTVLASVALGDLQAYAQQLDWVFPTSEVHYPTDSVIRVQRDRAAAWVRRLLAVRPRASWAVWGQELVSFGQVASRAGDDTLAAQLFDTRLAMLGGRLAEQSYVLREAIDAFTDPMQDSARLARNLVTAERYLVALRAIPRSGYHTEADSESVMLRQYSAEARVIEGYDAIGVSAEVVKRAMRLLQNMARQSFAEQSYAFFGAISYPIVVSAMAGQPNAAANIAALNTQYLAVGGESAQDMIACLAMVHRAAPPLAANAWLNTPDSAYRETPWVRPFTDGIVRVVLFDGAYSTDYVSVLERVQRAFPTGVQAVYATQTLGFFNSHTARPEDEIAWLATMYGKRHLAVPIAIWAGKRRMLEEEGSEPIPSPATEDYHLRQLEGIARVLVVLVDGHGVLQGFQSIVTRADETKLMRRIAILLAAEHAHAAPRAASPSAP